MKQILNYILLFAFMCTCPKAFTQLKYPALNSDPEQNGSSNKLPPQIMPVIGVWVWNEAVLMPDGYKQTIDEASEHSPFNLLIPFLRFPDKEVTDSSVYLQVKLAASYATERNMALIPDLDVRSARRAFKAKYPDELQQMLRLQEVKLSSEKTTEIIVNSIENLNDHYSGGGIPPYNALSCKLLRVYSYQNIDGEIVPESVKDITSICKTMTLSEDSLHIVLPGVVGENTYACAMVAFTLFYPDIFAPHLEEFQRNILLQYADVPVAGACKDEWGFPPYFPRFYMEGIHDFWYSKYSAESYSEKTGGRELLADCFLMSHKIRTRDVERQVAVNNFMEMVRLRNVKLEDSFYNAVKKVFGPYAAVTVHPTWWPYPDYNEFKKNGLDWWAVKRDWAQTDEIVPFAVRTALCKKWNSPIWYNMYYTTNLPVQVWSSVLAGGRIDYLGFQTLFDRDVMRAENRIRLLNYISNTPVDCRIAVVFGHASAVNWAGPCHNDVGMKLADTLWYSGYPADLIPTSEIENGSLKVDEEGWICYGKQRYNAVVLFNPEYEKQSTADFFSKAAAGKTSLYRVGNRTYTFNGEPVKQEDGFPKNMIEAENYSTAAKNILQLFRDLKIETQTPATDTLDSRYFKLRGYNTISYFPPATGFTRLIDGTLIYVAGTKSVGGDTMQCRFSLHGNPVFVDAVGILGIRLDKKGIVEALAAGGLKILKTPKMVIELDDRLDIALWTDQNGEYHGIVQGLEGPIPEKLLMITGDWKLLKLPQPKDKE